MSNECSSELSPANLPEKLEKLLTDPSFLLLHRLRGQSNIFETLAVSHLEMWNSAFVRWLLDPNSDLGLGDFPLKRFLTTVITVGEVGEKPDLDIGTIEKMDMDDVRFETEVNYPVPAGGKPGRLDIIGVGERTRLRIIIENKIDAQEGKDQTDKYYQFAKKDHASYAHDFLVFLTADADAEPDCKQFIHITYQHLCDCVIKPCLAHPSLTENGKYMLEQYLHNLGKGERVMAQPNADICKRIYEAHQEVLDEIFVAVKGVTPASGKTAYNISLMHLIKNGVMSISDVLYAKYKGVLHEAKLVERQGEVFVVLSGEEFPNPSRAGQRVRDNKSTNGWTFWSVKGQDGKHKGLLAELRDKVATTKPGEDS